MPAQRPLVQSVEFGVAKSKQAHNGAPLVVPHYAVVALVLVLIPLAQEGAAVAAGRRRAPLGEGVAVVPIHIRDGVDALRHAQTVRRAPATAPTQPLRRWTVRHYSTPVVKDVAAGPNLTAILAEHLANLARAQPGGQLLEFQVR